MAKEKDNAKQEPNNSLAFVVGGFIVFLTVLAIIGGGVVVLYISIYKPGAAKDATLAKSMAKAKALEALQKDDKDDGSPPMAVDLEEILKEDESGDPLAIARKYKGKRIEFSAIIDSTQEEIICIRPVNSNNKEMQAHCHFPQEILDDVAKLSIGQKVKITASPKPGSLSEMSRSSIVALEPARLRPMTAKEIARIIESENDPERAIEMIRISMKVTGLLITGTVKHVAKNPSTNPHVSGEKNFYSVTLDGTPQTSVILWIQFLPGRTLPRIGDTIKASVTFQVYRSGQCDIAMPALLVKD